MEFCLVDLSIFVEVCGMEHKSSIKLGKGRLHAGNNSFVTGACPHLPFALGRIVCGDGIMEFCLVDLSIFVLVGAAHVRIHQLLSRFAPEHDHTYQKLLWFQEAIHILICIKKSNKAMRTPDSTLFDALSPGRLC